jgi:hypothetical protein
LETSDAGVATIPETVTVPAGAIKATTILSAAQVAAVTAINVTALSGNSLAGTSFAVVPATTPQFSLALQPHTLSIASDKSASSTISTKVAAGFNHALSLSVSNVPSGVSVKLSSSVIPAPGAGTAKATVSVDSSATPGSYALHVKATDGTHVVSAILTLKIPSANPVATFQGCWYHNSGHSYQAALISVQAPGTYPFDAVLYYGTTCDPNNWADEFGYGQPLTFGGFDYIFWFTDFADQTDMSAVWRVGNSASQCVNYQVAPVCQ